MIDFRYHLVSIVAVFLALGLGILLGATALQPSALGVLNKTSQQEHQQIGALINTNGGLNRQLNSDDQWAQAAGPQLLRQLLAGQRVVLVEAPGASSQVVSGVSQALTWANATVSGQVQLQDKFFDSSPATQEQLAQLAQRFAPAPLTGSAVGQASHVIAGAVLTKDGPGQPLAGQRDSASAALLSGLAAGGFLTVSGHPDARATLAVVVTPESPPAPSGPSQASQGLLTLAQQLNLAGLGTVVAGPVTGSGQGSVIDLMRGNGRPSHLSSVDDADRTIGQIVVAQALFEQLHGVSGNFGSLSTAAAPGPSPLPTPSATASTGVRAVPRQSPRRAAPAGNS